MTGYRDTVEQAKRKYEQALKREASPLYQLRKRHKLSEVEMGRRCEVHAKTISFIEQGRTIPNLYTAWAIEDVARELEPDAGWDVYNLFPREAADDQG